MSEPLIDINEPVDVRIVDWEAMASDLKRIYHENVHMEKQRLAEPRLHLLKGQMTSTELEMLDKLKLQVKP